MLQMDYLFLVGKQNAVCLKHFKRQNSIYLEDINWENMYFYKMQIKNAELWLNKYFQVMAMVAAFGNLYENNKKKTNLVLRLISTPFLFLH